LKSGIAIIKMGLNILILTEIIYEQEPKTSQIQLLMLKTNNHGTLNIQIPGTTPILRNMKVIIPKEEKMEEMPTENN
jgi:hypothetical protein